jgi:hypothetical protein
MLQKKHSRRDCRLAAGFSHVNAGFCPVEQLEGRLLFSTYIVTGAGDGAGSVTPVVKGIYAATTLRGAIAAANAKPDTDLILLNPFFKGTITLSPAAGELAITNNVTIQGFGANRQAINGGGAGRVFSVAAGVTAEINDLTIFNGVAGQDLPGGGGIRNLGTLTLNRDTIRNNVVVTNDGGGVFNAGTLNVLNSTFSNNTAAGSGGGLFNKGTATVVNSTFAGNTASFGGGIDNLDGATLLVVNSTISGNKATISGGGIASTLNDPLATPGTRLNNTIVAGNVFNPSIPGALGPDLYGFFNSASSNNLIGSLGFAKGLDATKNLLGSIENATPAIDAMLAPLGDYGGTTQTMPPIAGSRAIDGGNNALVPAGVFSDQRGLSRISHGTVDIGAVEVQVRGNGNGRGDWEWNFNGNGNGNGKDKEKDKKDN